MLSVPRGLPVFLAVKPLDMRKSFDGLAMYIQSFLKMNPLKDGLFIFRNKSGDKVKLIYWHRNGLVIVYKRLEQGRFTWPRVSDESVSLTRQELELLLDGIDLSKLKRFPDLPLEKPLNTNVLRISKMYFQWFIYYNSRHVNGRPSQQYRSTSSAYSCDE